MVRFVGMLTDSRRFMSYTHHEYFRRILSNILGNQAEQRLIPNDRDLLDPLVKAVCHAKSKEYFGFPRV
jgi:glucuronate isomerase